MDKVKAIQFVKELYAVADSASVPGKVTRGIDAIMPALLEYLDKAEIPDPPEE